MKKYFYFVFIVIVLIGVVIVYMSTRGLTVVKYVSPDGRYYITASELFKNPFAVGGPGDGHWNRYIYRLYNSSNGQRLASSVPTLLLDEWIYKEEPSWFEDFVCVPDEQYLRYEKKK